MLRLFHTDRHDAVLWFGIGIFGLIIVSWFSLFTMSSPVEFILRFGITVAVMFLPGYFIAKLFFDSLVLSAYPALDKLMMSISLSIATVQTLYFILTYLRTYALDIDEDVISSDALSVTLAAAVMGFSFALKSVLIRRRAPQRD